MSSRIYLVPYDFSAVGNAAIKHALALAKLGKASVMLLHLVDDVKKVAPSQAKLEAFVKSLNLPFDAPQVECKTVKGSIFEDIGKIADKYEVNKIIMGTHGAKGFQKVFGSFAIKVMTSTNTPFIIVQESEPSKEINNIVVPIDLSKESLQIISHAADIAKLYNSKVHVIGENQRDEILERQMKNRIKLVEKKFEEVNVAANIQLLEKSGSYASKVIAYTKKIKAEMIALAYHTESLLPSFDTFAQNLITNTDKVPVLIIRSTEVSSTYF